MTSNDNKITRALASEISSMKYMYEWVMDAALKQVLARSGLTPDNPELIKETAAKIAGFNK